MVLRVQGGGWASWKGRGLSGRSLSGRGFSCLGGQSVRVAPVLMGGVSQGRAGSVSKDGSVREGRRPSWWAVSGRSLSGRVDLRDRTESTRVSMVQGEGWGLLEETGSVRAESVRSGCIPPGRTVCHRAGSVTMGGACQGGLRRSKSSSSLGRPGGGSVSLPGYLWTWGVLG